MAQHDGSSSWVSDPIRSAAVDGALVSDRINTCVRRRLSGTGELGGRRVGRNGGRERGKGLIEKGLMGERQRRGWGLVFRCNSGSRLVSYLVSCGVDAEYLCC